MVEANVCVVKIVGGVGVYIYTIKTYNMQGNMLDIEIVHLQVNSIDLEVTSTWNYTSSSYIVETTLVDIYLLGFFMSMMDCLLDCVNPQML
jgi:hypothetical protein